MSKNWIPLAYRNIGSTNGSIRVHDHTVSILPNRKVLASKFERNIRADVIQSLTLLSI